MARVAVAVVALGTAIPQPARAAEATVVVVGSAVKVRLLDHPSGSADATIFAARNEFESFQVVVEAGARDISDVSVSLASPLSGPNGVIPARDVTIYREAYYRVRQRSDLEGAIGAWPDALIPAVDPWYHETRNAFPVTVPAGRNRVAWVDVLAPADATPGDYTGTLAVTGEGLSAIVNVRLTVLNLLLHSTSRLDQAFGMSWDKVCLAHFGDDCLGHQEDGWRLKALYARAALDDRITISSPTYQPLVDSTQRAYFERYDLPLLRGRAPTRLAGARLTRLEVNNVPYLDEWKAEAKARGFGRQAFVYACDVPADDPSRWDDCKRQASQALAVWPGVPILITASIQSADRFRATPLIDIVVPNVQQMDDKPRHHSPYRGNQRAAYDEFLNGRNNRVWMYISCASEGCTFDPVRSGYFIGWPGYAIDEPASEARAMGWQSFRYDTSGELYFATDYDLPTAWTDQWAYGGNGDGTLFYPGRPYIIGGTRDIPIESMRLKLIRDGREDYEYLRFLQDHGKGSDAMAVAVDLFPTMYDSDRTDAAIQEARRQLADLIAGITGGPVP